MNRNTNFEKWKKIALLQLFVALVLLIFLPQPVPAQGTTVFLPLIIKQTNLTDPSAPLITSITTNLTDYPNNKLPRYKKFEVTFNLTTAAENLQLPYDSNPPAGIETDVGVTVNALFTPDNWQTVYSQPAFYYQNFDHEIKGNKDWIYPTDNFVWKVRFAPHQIGNWQYKLTAQDINGQTETSIQSFTVSDSDSPGFVRVSDRDSRYFEFEDGDHFLGLGYNLTYGQADWNNPTVTNESKLSGLHEEGLQLFRTWLSHWGIYSSAWSYWNSPIPERHGRYIPDASLRNEVTYPGSEVAMRLVWNFNPGMFLGFMKQSPAVKRDTTYHLSIRYLLPEELAGPRINGSPYGLVAKTGGWLLGSGSWPDNVNGYTDPGTGNIVSNYAVESPVDNSGQPQWDILEGEIQTGNRDFLPYLYLVLENVKQGSEAEGTNHVAFIDQVELREDLGNGQYGPNIISKGWMAQHLYFDQRNSYAFDKFLETAEAQDIYLKLVTLEKNEWISNRIDFEGNSIPYNALCWDQDSSNDPPEGCFGNQWFYGNGRQMTKGRWLQQAWWRYLQARWGYSTSIHSWELLNEGDPWNSAHYTMADEFGKYMHQFAPNDHLVSTSFWHSFPQNEFWANNSYPYIDYADLHAYSESSIDIADDTRYYSEKYGAKTAGGADKPLVRGETGFNSDIVNDTSGIWLHNYIWGGVNPGGMYEQYWYSKEHIEKFDLGYHYKPYLNFMAGIPLNNGDYQNIEASVSNNVLRAWGQKDLTRGCGHFWVQNKNHTWKNVVDNVAISKVSATVTLQGFQPNKTYTVEWWDTYQVDPAQQIINSESVTAQGDGTVTITISNLDTDMALKIVSQGGC